MSSIPESLEKLQQIANELEARGDASLSARLGREVAILREQTSPPKLMTTGEAARALGIRSVSTIKRWAQDGKLEGFRRGGRVLVSARSVAAMAESSLIAREQAFDRALDEAYAPFGIDGAEIPALGAAWSGRKPWESNAPARS
jgi:excisionase family DNA binding protein